MIYELLVRWTGFRCSEPLLENKSSELVEEVLRHRFYNRYPQTETFALSLGHRVFHPVL